MTLRVGRPDLPRRIDRRSGLSRAMDRPASAGPAVGRRDRTDQASSSTVVGRLGKAQPTCATRAGCAALDCEGPTDVAGIATVRRAGTRCGRVIPRMGPSPGIEGVGCPTLLYRFGYDKNFARRESWDANAASASSCQKCKPSHRPVKSDRHNLPRCQRNCKAKAGITVRGSGRLTQ